jgi:hypothetical protein
MREVESNREKRQNPRSRKRKANRDTKKERRENKHISRCSGRKASSESCVQEDRESEKEDGAEEVGVDVYWGGG